MEHVNIQEGYVDILESKMYKDRRLHLSHELANYLALYKVKIEEIWPGCTYFIPKDCNNAFNPGYLRSNFNKIWKVSNKEYVTSKVRLYDLRHHFALANLNRWIQEEKNIDTMILYLQQ